MDLSIFDTDEKSETKESKKRSSTEAFGFGIDEMFPKRQKTGVDNDSFESKDDPILVNSMFADVNQYEDNSENYDENMCLQYPVVTCIKNAMNNIFSVPHKSDNAFVIFEFQPSGMVLTANSTQMFAQFTLSKHYLGDNYNASKNSTYYIGVDHVKEVFKTDAKSVRIGQNANMCEHDELNEEAMYDPGSTLIVELSNEGESDWRLLCNTNSNSLGDSCAQNSRLRQLYNEKFQSISNISPVLMESKMFAKILKLDSKDNQTTVMLTLKKLRGVYNYMVTKKTSDQRYHKRFFDVVDDNIEDKFPKDDNDEFIVYKFALSDVNTLKGFHNITNNVNVYFLKDGLLVIYYPIIDDTTVSCSMFLCSNDMIAD